MRRLEGAVEAHAIGFPDEPKGAPDLHSLS